MQNFVNTNYNLNLYPVFNLKKRDSVSNPAQNTTTQNISFRGTEALAAYNYSLVNKNELFNLPIVEPLDIPTKIEDIDGEKIYTSDGDLARIICNDGNYKTTYYFKDNKLRYSSTNDINSNIKWEMYFDEGVFSGVSKILPDREQFSTFYENGKPIQISKYKMTSKGNDIEISYLPKDEVYSIQKHYTKDGKQYSSFADYDKDKKCIYASETEGLHNETTDLDFIDGKPYRISTTKSQALDEKIGKEDLDLTNLEPYPYCDIDIDKINSTEGERKYYSNGNLEKIIAENGDVYTFLPEGKLYEIENDTRKIQYTYEYMDGGYSGHNITEKTPDGGVKITQYGDSKDDYFDVWYESPVCKKHVTYNDKGTIVSYSNQQQGQKEISRDYDNNGNLIGCWDK